MKSKDYNLEGIPTAACLMCGGNWLNISVILDEETYEIAAYGLEAQCFSCGTKLTLATPEDVIEG